jgi:hypothetical protein
MDNVQKQNICAIVYLFDPDKEYVRHNTHSLLSSAAQFTASLQNVLFPSSRGKCPTNAQIVANARWRWSICRKRALFCGPTCICLQMGVHNKRSVNTDPRLPLHGQLFQLTGEQTFLVTKRIHTEYLRKKAKLNIWRRWIWRVVTPCSSDTVRRFGATYHLQGQCISQGRNEQKQEASWELHAWR